MLPWKHADVLVQGVINLPSSFSFVPVEAREMPAVPTKPNNYALLELYAVVRVCVCLLGES